MAKGSRRSRKPLSNANGPVYVRVLGIRTLPAAKERGSTPSPGTGQAGVPFGGKYRIIDFVLRQTSSFRNQLDLRPHPVPQPIATLQHLNEGWQFSGLLKSQFIIPVPAQMRSEDETWYQGTAMPFAKHQPHPAVGP